MKQRLMPLNDRLILQKRSIIETMINHLKNISQLSIRAIVLPSTALSYSGRIDCLLPSAEKACDCDQPQSAVSGLTRTQVHSSSKYEHLITVLILSTPIAALLALK
jgi:hypothetical protein